MGCIVAFIELYHLFTEGFFLQGIHFLVFLFLFYDSWEKSFDYFFLLFLLVLNGIGLVIFFWIFILVFVLFDQNIEIETHH